MKNKRYKKQGMQKTKNNKYYIGTYARDKQKQRRVDSMQNRNTQDREINTGFVKMKHQRLGLILSKT